MRRAAFSIINIPVFLLKMLFFCKKNEIKTAKSLDFFAILWYTIYNIGDLRQGARFFLSDRDVEKKAT